MTMRKTITTCLLLVLSLSLFARDIIVTKNNELIEANITEVSDESVRYKKLTLPDGPVFVIPAKDISSVVYGNGEIQSFMESPAPTTTQSVTVQESAPATTVEAPAEKIIYTAAGFDGDTLPRFEYKNVFVPIKGKIKKRYVGGNMILSSTEFSKYLDAYCPEVYKRVKKGLACSTIGTLLCFVGLGAGAALMPESPEIAPAVMGATSVIALTLTTYGLYYDSNLLEHYNASCAGTPVKKRQ